MALRAYIDDSGSQNQHPALVLSGYLATAEQWAAFSDEWDAACRMAPRIKYFKMAEAVRCKGEFDRWPESLRDERLKMLHRIIEAHAQFFVSVIVPYEGFMAARATIPFKLPFRPYMAAFMGLMAGVRTYGDQIGIKERVDFIFDDQVMEKKILMDNWDFAAAAVEPEERERVSKTPLFQNDMDVLPLQAGDMIAWLQRNMWEVQSGVSEPYVPPWTSEKEIEGITFIYDEESIRKILHLAYEQAKAELNGSA